MIRGGLERAEIAGWGGGAIGQLLLYGVVGSEGGVLL